MRETPGEGGALAEPLTGNRGNRHEPRSEAFPCSDSNSPLIRTPTVREGTCVHWSSRFPTGAVRITMPIPNSESLH